MSQPTLPDKAFVYQLDLLGVIKLLWIQRYIIIGVVSVSIALSVWYALAQDEIYRVVLKATPSESSLVSDERSLQATLALRMRGFFNATGEYEKHFVAVEVLKSQHFLASFIQRYNIAPYLYAVKKYDADTNKIVWDDNIYDPLTQTWHSEKIPTLQEALNIFRLQNLVIDDNRDNRVLTLHVYHQSPYIAEQWANWLLNDLNLLMQEKHIAELEQKIEFLKQELSETQNADLRAVIFQGIEKNTLDLLKVRSTSSFLFEIIDPTMIPDRRARPQRGILIIICTLLGGILGVVVAVGVALIRPPKDFVSFEAKGV